MRNDYVLARYGEVLLNKAEAMMRQGKPGAEMFVNMIRQRAGMPDMDADMTMDDLLEERGRELFYEGLRRQELIRFGRFTDAWWQKPEAPPTAILFPKPAPQLNANPNLEQNDGY
jgi:hypothetical protein